MAQIDSSIYSQLQAPDIMGSVDRGLRMRDMIDQRTEKKSIKDAYKSGYKLDEAGNPSVDYGTTASELIKRGHVQEGMGMMAEHKKQQAADLENNFKKLEGSTRLLGSVTNQASWDKARQLGAQFGLDMSKEPEIYDPSYVKMRLGMGLSAKDQLEQQWKEKNYGLEKEKVGIQRESMRAKKAAGQSVGQKEVDKKFAKDYNEWTSGSAKTARSEIGKLQNVVNDLKNEKVTTGGLTGMFYDRLTSSEVLKARSDVQSTVMNSLRAILGAQFTEKEGERIIKNTWNEADTTENNVARLERLVGDLEAQANDKDEKSRFYENSGGSLSGFKPMSSSIQQTRNDKKASAKTFKTNEIEW